MGYYTDYTINIVPDNDMFDYDAFEQFLVEETGYQFDMYEQSFHLHGKWYEWKEDMIKVSKNYPDIVFYVDGEGEENNDLWKARFYNGEAVTVEAQITFPDFPPLKK